MALPPQQREFAERLKRFHVPTSHEEAGEAFQPFDKILDINARAPAACT